MELPDWCAGALFRWTDEALGEGGLGGEEGFLILVADKAEFLAFDGDVTRGGDAKLDAALGNF